MPRTDTSHQCQRIQRHPAGIVGARRRIIGERTCPPPCDQLPNAAHSYGGHHRAEEIGEHGGGERLTDGTNCVGNIAEPVVGVTVRLIWLGRVSKEPTEKNPEVSGDEGRSNLAHPRQQRRQEGHLGTIGPDSPGSFRAVSYSVKEIVYTLQGEGANSGRPAVFCRFSGCNLWSGREQDRAAAICNFCDTDFLGVDGPLGGRFPTAEALAAEIGRAWGERRYARFVVFTGGEPLLQLNEELIKLLHGEGFAVAVETNGTLDPPPGLDWICVSPKFGAPMRLRRGNELKLIFPQAELDPADYVNLDFEYFFLQPMDSADLDHNRQAATAYCLRNPRWRLSLQTHKLLGIP